MQVVKMIKRARFTKRYMLYLSYAFLLVVLVFFTNNEPWRFQDIAIATDKDRPSPAILQIILDMKVIAGAGTSKSFQLSPPLLADPYIVQRATEFLYPYQIVDKNAPTFAVDRNELAKGCQLIAKRTAVAAYDCP